MQSSNGEPSREARLCDFDVCLFLLGHRRKIGCCLRFLGVFLKLRYFRDAWKWLFWPQIELKSKVPWNYEIFPVQELRRYQAPQIILAQNLWVRLAFYRHVASWEPKILVYKTYKISTRNLPFLVSSIFDLIWLLKNSFAAFLAPVTNLFFTSVRSGPTVFYYSPGWAVSPSGFFNSVTYPSTSLPCAAFIFVASD